MSEKTNGVKFAALLCVLFCLLGCSGEDHAFRVLERQYGDHFIVVDGVPFYLYFTDRPVASKIKVNLLGIEEEYIREVPEFSIEEVRWDEEYREYVISWQYTNRSDKIEEFEVATVEQEIDGKWYVVIRNAATTADRKLIEPGETKTCNACLNNAANRDERMPDGRYRLVRKMGRSNGVVYYAAVEFEIQS